MLAKVANERAERRGWRLESGPGTGEGVLPRGVSWEVSVSRTRTVLSHLAAPRKRFKAHRVRPPRDGASSCSAVPGRPGAKAEGVGIAPIGKVGCMSQVSTSALSDRGDGLIGGGQDWGWERMENAPELKTPSRARHRGSFREWRPRTGLETPRGR